MLWLRLLLLLLLQWGSLGVWRRLTLLPVPWRLLSLRRGTSWLLLLLWGPLLLLLLLRCLLLLWWLPWPSGLWIARLTLRALLALRAWTLLLLLRLRLLLLLGSAVGWLPWLGLLGLAIRRLTLWSAVGTLGLLVRGTRLPMLARRLRRMALLGVGRTRTALGLTGVWLLLLLLLLPRVGGGGMLTIVALTLLTIASRPLLSIG